VTTDFHDDIRIKDHRLAQLKSRTAALERELADARGSLERELAHAAACLQDAAPVRAAGRCDCAPGSLDHRRDATRSLRWYGASAHSGDCPGADPDQRVSSAEARTEILVNRGRRGGYHQALPRGRKLALGLAVAAVLTTILVIRLSGGGASWPPSVATVQREAARACQNPDVKSEPDQVNFACASATRQVLWVFALITSDDNPAFADVKTGRTGLEPITPAQGGDVAWSLNLHHPYDPANPIDSLAVAARAINNIVGGATLTSANGSPLVQSGLESVPANCLQYTGSAAVASRRGFPAVCAKPVTSPAGQAALVSDIYQRWVVGAAPSAAQDAAVLFENAQDPGAPQVQAILRWLAGARPSA